MGHATCGQGFNRTNLDLFKRWRGLVEKIWFPNGLAAQIPGVARQAQLNRDYPGWGTSDGNVFCSTLAKNIDGYVVAATEIQCEYLGKYPADRMSSFEELVLSYGPQGAVTWSSRNPSTWTTAGGACVPVPK